MTRPTTGQAALLKARGFRLRIANAFAQRLQVEGLTELRGYEEAIRAARRVPGGRSPNWILERHEPDQPIRVRPCQHGGVFGPWLRDRALTPNRVFREFAIWIALRERRIPIPVPVFAISRRQGFFWRSAFASLECRGALDGIEWLSNNPSPLQLRKVCLSFAKALRQFHDVGAIHGDLHIRNLLIEWRDPDAPESAPSCLLIDLDRTRIQSRVSPRQRMAELLRLLRSLEKTGNAAIASSRIRAFTLSSYCAGDRELRREMLCWSRFEAIRMGRHRLAWRMQGTPTPARR
jgi:tRNA A-37 threonylcarbamoyl transferase component Bud32